MDFKRIAVEALDNCEGSFSSFDSLTREIEKHIILLALQEFGSVSAAAVALRMNRTTLHEKRKKFGIGERSRVVKIYELNSSLEGKNEKVRDPLFVPV